MKNKSNDFLIGLSVVLVGLAGFFVVKAIMNKPTDGQEEENDKNNDKGKKKEDGNKPVSIDFTSTTFPIKKGSKSGDIKALQQLILKYDNRLLPVYKDDGKWGIETQTALQKIIKKSSVDSQADLDKITQLGVAKAGVLLSGFKLF